MKFFRYFLRALWVVLFVLVFVFARRNDEQVILHLIPGIAWEAPLVLVVLAAFATGILLGTLACAARWVRQRREILRLKRELRGRGAGPQAQAGA